MTIDKIVRLGTQSEYGRTYSVFCHIQFDGKRLSITGVEGPLKNGNALGSCGQITETIIDTPAPGWTEQTIERFREIWKRWHLNDMRAGSPRQITELSKHTFPGYPANYYDWACEILRNAGLHEDNGYRYGSAWLLEEVPADVLAELSSLPDTDMTPNWV